MLVVFSVSFIALMFCYLDSKGSTKGGMLLGFILVTIVAAIRYDYGNDYPQYQMVFDIVASTPFSFSSLSDVYANVEPGWILFCYLCKPIGFEGQVAIVSIFESVVFYQLIKNNLPKEYWTFACFIYLFNNKFYLLNMSMMRQGVAISICIIAFSLMRERKVLCSVIMMVLAFSVHKSALFFFPFSFLGLLKFGNSKFVVLVFVSFFICTLLSANILNRIFSTVMLIGDFESYYEVYEGRDQVQNYGFGFVFTCIIFLVLMAYLLRSKSNIRDLQLVSIAAVGTLIIPFQEIIVILGRVAYYFNTFSIVAVPIAYKWIKRPIIRYAVTGLFVLLMVYSYFHFFGESSSYRHGYYEYHTIFSK